MPLIQLAIKLGARYGPLLLMLAEADPQGVLGTPGLIAAGPSDALRRGALPTLEQQVRTELSSNQHLRAITVVEIARLTPEWLDEQQRLAHAGGVALRIVFVDSRAVRTGTALSPALLAHCRAAGVAVQGTPGLGARVAAGVPPKDYSMFVCSAAQASLMGSVAAVF